MGQSITTLGTELAIGDGGAVEQFIRVPEVTEISDYILVDTEFEDASSFDTPIDGQDKNIVARTLKPMTFTVNFVPGHPVHEKILTDMTNVTERNFQMREAGPAGKLITITAFIKTGGDQPVRPRSTMKARFTLEPTRWSRA